VKAEITSRGPILVGPEADLIGDVTAPSMAIGAGAVLEGYYEVGRVKPKQVDPEPEIGPEAPPATTPPEAEEPIDPEA
jgi:cytoskeletal protein CcmA (bactofilin family)